MGSIIDQSNAFDDVGFCLPRQLRPYGTFESDKSLSIGDVHFFLVGSMIKPKVQLPSLVGFECQSSDAF